MLIIDGQKIAAEWCLDWEQTGLYFGPGYAGCAKRRHPVRLGVGHWTGGEAGTKRVDDDGAFVFRVLRSRVTASGDPMPLSCHFTIGADGTTWQYADVVRTECFHASAVNSFSWGVEIVNDGLPPSTEGRPRKTVTRRVHGKDVEVLEYYPEQLEAFVRLCNAVHDALKLPRRVPGRQVAGKVAGKGKASMALEDRRIPQAKLREWTGAIEHLHCSSTKRDGGTMLVAALAQDGWAVEEID